MAGIYTLFLDYLFMQTAAGASGAAVQVASPHPLVIPTVAAAVPFPETFFALAGRLVQYSQTAEPLATQIFGRSHDLKPVHQSLTGPPLEVLDFHGADFIVSALAACSVHVDRLVIANPADDFTVLDQDFHAAEVIPAVT